MVPRRERLDSRCCLSTRCALQLQGTRASQQQQQQEQQQQEQPLRHDDDYDDAAPPLLLHHNLRPLNLKTEVAIGPSVSCSCSSSAPPHPSSSSSSPSSCSSSSAPPSSSFRSFSVSWLDWASQSQRQSSFPPLAFGKRSRRLASSSSSLPLLKLRRSPRTAPTQLLPLVSLLLLLFVFFFSSASSTAAAAAAEAAQEEGEGECQSSEAKHGCGLAEVDSLPGQAYYWPNQKGDLNRSGWSQHIVPRKLDATPPSWRWEDPEPGVVRATPLIDDKFNLYFSTVAGQILKLSARGEIIWTYRSRDILPAVPVLLDGVLYSVTITGTLLALSMETGKELWTVKIGDGHGTDCASLSISPSEKLIISSVIRHPPKTTESDEPKRETNNAVVAVSTKGVIVWNYTVPGSSFALYNFQGALPGDGSLVFMDASGGLYKLRVSTGEEEWISGIKDRKAEWFTTAAVVVGPNGIIYCVSNVAGGRGLLHAYDLADGSEVWRYDLKLQAMQAVSVGALVGSEEELSVVLGVGANPGFPIFMRMFYYSFLAPPFVFWAIFSAVSFRAWQRQRRQGFSAAKRCCRLPLNFVLVLIAWILGALALHYANLELGGRAWGLLFGSTLERPRVIALDAKSGKERWSYELPKYERSATAGDEEQLLARYLYLNQGGAGHPICLPDSFAQPVISGDGTAFLGYQDGRLLIFRDSNGNGRIEADLGEVGSFDFGHGFQASQALAPGLLAVAPCDGGLWVWRD